MHFCLSHTISRQMLESPLSSLNKQLNWADLQIIYRIESRGATAFVQHKGVCVFALVELVGQSN